MKYLLVQNMLYRPTWGGANKATAALMEQLAIRNSCDLIAPALGSYGPASIGDWDALVQGVGVSDWFATADVRTFASNRTRVHAVVSRKQLGRYVADRIRELEPDWILVACEDPGQVCLYAAHETAPDRIIYLVQTPWSLPFGKWSIDPNPGAARVLERARFVTISKYLRDYIREACGLESMILPFPVYGRGPFANYVAGSGCQITIINPSALKGIDIFLGLADVCPERSFAAVPTW